jgi:hypothetical protein
MIHNFEITMDSISYPLNGRVVHSNSEENKI